MRSHALWPVMASLAVLLASCAPAAEPRSGAREAGPGSSSGPKNLTVVLDFEPQGLLPSMSGVKSSELRYAASQPLTSYDQQGGVIPRLAAEVPSLENETWLVRPDGTMRVTYRLRPNVTWHDGAPFTSKDVAFSWAVNVDPEIPSTSKNLVRQIARVDTPDDLTAVLEWKSAYPFAHVLVKEELGPYPKHLLEASYFANKGGFANLPYFTQEYVGVGPYRLESWESGSHLVLRAYDNYFLGRPLIDTITVRFIENHDTIVANMLAGAVDGSPWIVKPLEAMTVIEGWERVGHNPVAIFQSDKVRALVVQFRNPRVPEVAGDVRVRRALLHAIDRQQLTDLFSLGKAPLANAFVHVADVTRQEWFKDVITTYEQSPRRAQQLLDDVWRVGPEGIRVNAAGQPIMLPIEGSSETEDTTYLPILGDQWKGVGVGTEQKLSRRSSPEEAATFPGLKTAPISFEFSGIMARLYGPDCPTEATRWIGANSGCYQNPGLDRAVQGLLTAIDPNQQRPLYQQWARVVHEDLPMLPLYYTVNVALFREGVIGVKGETVPATEVMWNVHEWNLRS